MAGACSLYGEVEKCGGKRPLGIQGLDGMTLLK
jgi:hypothetical protein